MARTYITTDNSRGNEVSAAEPSFAHLRGWNAGVRVRVIRGERDDFEITMTGGSHGGTATVLGTVRDTPDGPVWVPAQKQEEEI
jgi:hypothetical protein